MPNIFNTIEGNIINLTTGNAVNTSSGSVGGNPAFDQVSNGAQEIPTFENGTGGSNANGTITQVITGDTIGDRIVFINISANYSDAHIYINGKDTEIRTPATIQIAKKELLQSKDISVHKTGFDQSETYKISLDVSQSPAIILVDKFDSDGSRMPSNIDTSNNTFDLQYTLSPTTVVDTDIVKKLQIQVDGNANNVVKYTYRDFTDNVSGEADVTILGRGREVILNEADPDNYSISKFEIYTLNEETQQLLKIREEESNTLSISVDTNYIVKVFWDVVIKSNPTVQVDVTEFKFNIADETTYTFEYQSTDTEFVKFKLRDIERTLEPVGNITLSNVELNTIGNYIIYLTPIDSNGIQGNTIEVLANVVSDAPVIDQPISISAPTDLIGIPFSGYDFSFDVEFSAKNSDSVLLFIGNTNNANAIGKYSPISTITLNIQDLVQKYGSMIDIINDKSISFTLVFRPEVKSYDQIQIGTEESVKIIFTQNEFTIPKSQVIEDISNALLSSLDASVFKRDASNLLNHIAHFGDGDNKLITTWAVDTNTFTDFTFDEIGNQVPTDGTVSRSLILKLYEPLPKNIEPNQLIWISKLQSVPIIEQVTIIGEEDNYCLPLQGPNFNIDTTNSIGYQLYEDLIAVSSSTSTDIINTFVSQSGIDTRKLDIQYQSGSYYNFEEFVHYSSAEERARNFYYKIQLLESYNTKITQLTSGSDWTGSAAVITESNKYITLKNGLINTLDGYEYFLYNETGSLSYPKSGSVLLSYSSSTVDAWFDSLLSDSIEWDSTNSHYLLNNVPEYIKEEEENDEYRLFLTMIGQHFDILWSYIKALSRNKKLETTRTTGITDDMIYHVLQSFGWDAKTAYKSQYLWQYAFGTDKDGNVLTTSTGKEIQSEIWRRILNNLPYILKHKGTRRSLYAVMSCYGVPQSLLTIMEFGGPQDPTQGGTTSFTFDDRTAALLFNGAEYLEVPWQQDSISLSYPSSVELSFKTQHKQNHTLIDSEGWDLLIIKDTGSLGKLQFNISSSGTVVSASTELFPIFNDSYTQVAITKDISGSNAIFTLYGKEGFQERIRQDVSATVTVATGSYGWESGSVLSVGFGFSGSIDEIRLWDTSLSESVINNHTLMPDAIDGNHISSSTEDLLLRLDFELPKNLNNTPLVKNVALKTSYGVNDVSASSFSNVATYPYQYDPYERTVTARVPSTGINVGNKFRFESQTLIGDLDYKSRATKKSLDQAPVDTNRLGLFFSPVRELNLDIVRGLGQFNIDNYIGKYSDDYEDSYLDLDLLRKYVFSRYDLNFYEYLRLVRYIDKSLFDTLESLIPARVKTSKGILIEPHILQRSKVKWTKPTSLRNDFEGTHSVNDEVIPLFEQEIKEMNVAASSSIEPLVFRDDLDSTIENEDFTELTSDLIDYSSAIEFTNTTELVGTDLQYTSSIDAELGEPTIQTEIDIINAYEQIGMEPDSISNALFGIYGQNSHTLRTYRDVYNNYIHERKRVFIIKESYTVDIPKLITPYDESGGTELETVTKYRYRVTFLDYNASAPVVGTKSLTGTIVEVTGLNGIADAHYVYVNDTTTGLQRSFSEGSKNSSSTTIDGQSPIQSIISNPNVLRVSDTDRGSGAPILEVD